MTNVAWVGSHLDFHRQLNCGLQKSVFVDKENDITYYCISTRQDMMGRRFHKIERGCWDDRFYANYAALYAEIETRIMPKE